MSEIPEFVQVSSEEIAAKVIEGEAVIINLSTGVYYSTDGAGARIWSMIERRQGFEEISANLQSTYQISAEQSVADIQTFAKQLLEEGLVSAADAPSGDLPTGPDPEDHRPYVAPHLMIYRDMGDLLALDPPILTPGQIPWADPSKENSSPQQ